MRDSRRKQIYKHLNANETEDLLEIWQNGDASEWEPEVFEIIKEILVERLGYLPPQSIETQVWQILDKVEAHLENNEFDKALRECELAIQLDPDFAVSYNYRGEIYLETGQLETAIENFQKAIGLDPELKDAWKNMLSIESELEEEFEESVTKQHLNQALEYVYDDEPEKALAECETAKLSLPRIAIAYNYLGLILQTLNQLEAAIDSYQKAVQLNPRLYAASENLTNAKKCWEEEQFRLFVNSPLSETQVPDLEIDESQILESEEPLPKWVYMDEQAFYLVGWAGHRTRFGRSGYDPLEQEFELAHIQGTIIRALFTGKFRTRNPVYLAFMTFMGLLYFLYGVLPFTLGNLSGIVTGLIFSPYTVVGALLLTNVYRSFPIENTDEFEDESNVFF